MMVTVTVAVVVGIYFKENEKIVNMFRLVKISNKFIVSQNVNRY